MRSADDFFWLQGQASVYLGCPSHRRILDELDFVAAFGRADECPHCLTLVRCGWAGCPRTATGVNQGGRGPAPACERHRDPSTYAPWHAA